MMLLRNISKTCLALFILLLISVLSILFLQFDRNKLKTEIVNKSTLLSGFIKDSDDRSRLEGKELYKLLDIPKDKILSVLNSNDKEYNIFVVLDSIDCFSCFQFHINNINELSKKNIPVLTYSIRHSDYLKNSLHKSINLSFKNGQKNKIIDNINMVILLINKKGKIIYADVADKTNYKKSKIFYHKINNFIFSE